MQLQAYPRFDSWEPQLLQKLLDTPNLYFLWAMQETSGVQATDYSGLTKHGTYVGATLDQVAPSRRVNKTVALDGINDKITPPAGCSVRSLGAVTFFAVAEITNNGTTQILWTETVNDADAATGQARFAVYKTDTVFSAGTRSGKKAQLASIKNTSAAFPVGFCILHVTVDITADTIAIYRNGSSVSSTGTIDFGADTIFEDTAPALGPICGRGVIDATPFWYQGKVGYLGMYSRVLTADEILNHAKAGGFV